MNYEFKFPDVGEGIAEGEIVKWHVKEKDFVKKDQVIAEIETDKAIVQMPSPKEGVILRLNKPEGAKIKVGEILAVISDSKDSIQEQKEKPKSVSVVGELEENTLENKIIKKETKDKKSVLATPSVRSLANSLGINITTIKPSGKYNRITESDVQNALANKPLPAEESSEQPKILKKFDFFGYIERIPLKGIRKTISDNMIKSHDVIPSVTHFDEIDITEISRIREKERTNAEKKNIRLTYLPFIVKALVSALKEHPFLNSSLEDENIILKKYYNIGIAVDTVDGLLVPVIKGCDGKSVLQIASEIEKLADDARSRKINLQDLKGSTFTLTNVGSIGGIFATPIINYPEAAIIALGKIYDKAVVKDNSITIRKILPVSLTFDHRILDGAEAARFANGLKLRLEDPNLLFLELD